MAGQAGGGLGEGRTENASPSSASRYAQWLAGGSIDDDAVQYLGVPSTLLNMGCSLLLQKRNLASQ